MNKFYLFLLLGLGQVFCFLALYKQGDLTKDIATAQILFFISFFLYTLCLLIVSKSNVAASPESPVPEGNYLLFIIIFAVSARMIMLAGFPNLSDDIFRYVWEGRVLLSGYNPFEHAPDDPALNHLRESTIFPLVARKNLTAIYPPLSQYLFAASVWISYSIYSVKTLFMIFDLLTVFILFYILKALNIDRDRIAIYALNPLVIIEFSGSGHSDSAGIFFLMLALYLSIKNRSCASIFMLAFSSLNKFYPAVFLPFIKEKNKIAGTGLFLLVVVFFYLPFLNAGIDVFNSLLIYGQHWFFNASFYDIGVLFINNRTTVKLVCAVFFAAVILANLKLFLKRSGAPPQQNIFRVCFIVTGAFLILSPVVHPWYVCWIVPFLVILPNRAWILFSGLVFLSYMVLSEYAKTGVWEESLTVKLGQYLPLYAFLLYDFIRNRRKPF